MTKLQVLCSKNGRSVVTIIGALEMPLQISKIAIRGKNRINPDKIRLVKTVPVMDMAIPIALTTKKLATNT